MTTKILYGLSLIATLFLFSCFVKNENNEDDIQKAVKVCEKYFSAPNIDSAFKLTGNVTKNDFERSIIRTDSAFGKVLNYSYIDGRSTIQSYAGTHAEGEYYIRFAVVREKIKTTKTFYLKLNKDEIKIVSSEENAQF